MGIRSYLKKINENTITTDINDKYSIEEYNYQINRLSKAVTRKKKRMPIQFIISSKRLVKDPSVPAEITMLGYVN